MPSAPSTQVVFVTGKGGAGKTTVAAALGVHLGDNGQRTLLVETDRTGQVADLLGAKNIGPDPTKVRPRLHIARLQPRALIEEYFRSLLRLPFLSGRLLSSRTFNAVTAAAPGVTEFLLLQKLLQWVDPGWGHRRRFDFVIVDGPATGHALKLLGAPRTIASLVPAGPIGGVARHALALLADWERARVVLVTIPEDLAVTETIEAYDTLSNDLALHVTRPVINRVFPRRFTARDVAALGPAANGHNPLAAAARFELARRREAERHLARLRRALQQPALTLPMVFDERLSLAHLDRLGHHLSPLLAEPAREHAIR